MYSANREGSDRWSTIVALIPNEHGQRVSEEESKHDGAFSAPQSFAISASHEDCKSPLQFDTYVGFYKM